MTHEPTYHERIALRMLAELGGEARSNELREHDDWTTQAHFINLRDKGYIRSRPTLDPETTPRQLTWTMTDQGRAALHEEAEAWETARDSLESDSNGGVEA